MVFTDYKYGIKIKIHTKANDRYKEPVYGILVGWSTEEEFMVLLDQPLQVELIPGDPKTNADRGVILVPPCFCKEIGIAEGFICSELNSQTFKTHT